MRHPLNPDPKSGGGEWAGAREKSDRNDAARVGANQMPLLVL